MESGQVGCEVRQHESSTTSHLTTYLDADRLQFGRLALRTLGRWAATHAESALQSLADGSDVLLGDAEARSRKADVVYEPTNLLFVERHELVQLVHGRWARVRIGGVAKERAAKEACEVRVEMGDETAVCFWSVPCRRTKQMRDDSLLVAGGVVRWLVLLEGCGTTSIQEVHTDTSLASSVGRLEGAGEVDGQVDTCIVAGTWSEDSRDSDERARVGRVVSDDGSVDDQGEDGLLVGCGVVLQQSGGV